MSGNTWYVTMQDKIFDAKCVVAQEKFFPNGCSSVYLVPDGEIRLKKYFLVLIMGHSF